MQEKKVMDLLVQAHNEYVKLEPTHPDDVRDWVNAMHTIQDIVGRRLLRDHFPEIYAKYPKSEDRINIGEVKEGMLTARMISEKGGDIRYTCDRCKGNGKVISK